jgi:hypothetical protein
VTLFFLFVHAHAREEMIDEFPLFRVVDFSRALLVAALFSVVQIEVGKIRGRVCFAVFG